MRVELSLIRPALLLCCCGFLVSGSAEEFQVRNWHVEDGLPDGSISALAQTTDGFLWVGTPKGLVRFDGARFSRAGSDGGHGLQEPCVSGLLAARDGSLWIVSERGVVMQFAEGRYQLRFLSSPMAQSLGAAQRARADARENPGGGQVWQALGLLAQDREQRVWALAGDATLLRFDPAGTLTATPTNGLPEGVFRGVCRDAAGNIWVAKGRAVCSWREEQWRVFPMPEEVFSETPLLCAGHQDGIWIADSGGGSEDKFFMQRTEAGWGAPSRVKARNQLSALVQDRRGRLWLSDWWGGVRMGDPSAPAQWQFVVQQGALAKCVVTCLFEDRQGSIWAGTVGEGLHQIVRRRVDMVLLPLEVSDAAITAVCPARDGALWASTGGKGVSRWQAGRVTCFGVADGLPSESVDAIAEDAHGRIWVSAGAGLARFDGTSFRSVPGRVSALAMMVDRAGDFWLGGSSRLIHLRDGTNAASFFAMDQRSLDIRSLAEDKAGHIWLAAYNSGVWQLQDSTLVPANAQLGLTRTDARSLFCDADGVLWIGTLNGGLFRWDGRQLKHYLMADGIPDDSIIGLAADENGILWMASANGIFGCSRRSLAAYERGRDPKLSCWHLGLADGLANRGCSGGGQSVIGRGVDGKFWVANMVGAAGFDSATVTQGDTPTNIFVDAVLADGVELEPVNSEIRVSTSARRFEFRFTAPDLASPRLLHFRHRLDPLDQDWVDAATVRSATYSKLAGGDYRFRVMVSGGDGVWHEGGQALTLRVVPRLWELRWVQVLALALVISAVGAGRARSQRRKLQLQLERLEMQHAVEKERLRIARDIHDQLGASLTQIALMSEPSRPEATDERAAGLQLPRIAAKARSVVSSLNEIVWAVNPANDNLPKLLDFICSFSEELCESAGVRCWHEVPTGLPPTPLQVDFRHNVVLAVREALNNAIKHSGTSEVWLRAATRDGEMRVEVEDRGRGFDVVARSSAGNGLNNLRARLEKIGGRAEVMSRIGQGTTVSLVARLPAGSQA